MEKARDVERYVDSINKKVENAEQQASYHLNILNNEVSKFAKQTKNEFTKKNTSSNNSKTNEITLTRYRTVGFDEQINHEENASEKKQKVNNKGKTTTIMDQPVPEGLKTKSIAQQLQKDLKTLVTNISVHGVYEGSKEYVEQVVDYCHHHLSFASDDQHQQIKKIDLLRSRYN